MKLTITLKDPDGVYDAINDAAQSSASNVDGLRSSEITELIEARREKLKEKCAHWIKYGEYVTIEIDTDAGTAAVCEA